MQPRKLDSCITWLQKAVAVTPEGYWFYRWRLFVLAHFLRSRSSMNQNQEELKEAIALFRTVVESLQETDRLPGPGECRYQLSKALLLYYEHWGDIESLHFGTMYARQAVDSVSEHNPSYPTFLQQLASSLKARARLTGHRYDLLDSVSLMRHAVKLAPRRADVLFTCATTLKAASMWLDDRQYIEEILDVLYKGMEIDSGRYRERFHSEWLTVLGHTYAFRGEGDDLDHAASLLTQAEAMSTQEPCVSRAWILLHRAEVEAQRGRGGLSDALDLVGDAMELLAPNHRLRIEGVADTMVNILTGPGDSKLPLWLLQRSIDILAWAAQSPSISPHARFRAAVCWARYCEEGLRTDAAEAFSIALELLPRLTSVGLDIDSRHQMLASEALGLASDAAASIMAFIPETGLEKSVEMLEVGRAVFWAQALQLRTSFDALATQEPDLADELAQVSKELEARSFRILPTNVQGRFSAETLAANAHNHHLSQRWEELLSRCRSVPGFEDFLQPKRFSDLCASANGGAVIIVNASRSYCDALIIRSSPPSVECVPLPIKYAEVAEMAEAWRSLLEHYGRSCRSTRSAQERQESQRGGRVRLPPEYKSSKDVLAALWSRIVQPILETLNPPTTEPLMRLWWCATGPFASLPLHAAGKFEGQAQECLMDVAISSYTPTLTALLTEPRSPDGELQLLAVAQEETPDMSPLPNTKQELHYIRDLATSVMTVNSLTNKAADVTSVSAGIRKCNWLHLACHGLQPGSKPLNSAFLLHDGRLTLSNIMQIPTPHAQFAFLSACETALGDADVPDEGIHLAGAMLFAGFPSVIATSWSIEDEDGPIVARDVYEHLLKGGKPDASEAALALHNAVCKLRAQGASVLRWAPFIHLGR
ncbi:unnamed protein product [Somion occarium]